MNRTITNVIIDLAAASLFVGMIVTGYILRFPLPPGTNRVLTLWGFTRHQWGTVHFWISLGMLAVIVIHLGLHWKWIVTVVGKRLRLVKRAHPESPIIAIVSGAKPGMRMLDRHKLDDNEVSLLCAWIDAGANWHDRRD